MRMPGIAMLVAAFALAACGEEQNAQNTSAPATPAPAPQVAQPAPPAAPPAAPPTASAPATPAAPSGGTTASLPPRTAAPDAATGLDGLMGRTFRGGPASLQLNNDGTFVMQQGEADRSVQGRYAYVAGAITFLDAEGDTGAASFPMRCRMERVSAGSFKLDEDDGTCRQMSGVTFNATN